MYFERRWFFFSKGWKKPSAEEIYEEQDKRMREEYRDLIEHFPEKIDQLLNALNRVYFMQRKRSNSQSLVLDLHGST